MTSLETTVAPSRAVPRAARRVPRWRRAAPSVVMVLLLAVATGACSSSAGTQGSTPTSVEASTVTVPLPAGKDPSAISIEVCSTKAQVEISDVLGLTADVSSPTWVDHRYSCRYRYRDGSFEISVKELSSWSETYAYFDGLGSSLGRHNDLGHIGQADFSTDDGSIVVRKDWKVLLVDASMLPAEFGSPPTSRLAAAYAVAVVILDCWAGD